MARNRKIIFPDGSPTMISLLFLLVAGFGIYRHEMWRDEFEIFMILRDATGFTAIFANSQLLPNLYITLLYPIIKLWPYPAVFQTFHLVVIASAVFVFNRYSPFSLLQKVFFTFSYFVLFEYGIISRDYSMLLLLLFASVALITREKQNFILISVSLLLLANHHIYGVFFAISLFLYMVLQVAGRQEKFTATEKKRLIMAATVLAAGCLYLVPQYLLLRKVSIILDHFGQPPWYMTIRSVWNAYFPIPGTTGIHFWNTNIFPFPYAVPRYASTAQYISAGNVVAVSFSIAILLAGVIIFSRNKPVMVVFLLNTAIQIFFLQHLALFFVRYQGPLFIIFIYSCWLLLHSDKNTDRLAGKKASREGGASFFIRRVTSPAVSIILFVQFCIGIFCYIQNTRYPFSASYRAAAYIVDNKLTDTVMLGCVDYVAQAISGHLGTKIYYPQSGDFGTNVKWMNPNRRQEISPDELIESGKRLYNEHGKNVLLLLSGPITDDHMQPGEYLDIGNHMKVRLLAEFTESIVPDEQYYLYLLYRN